MANPKEPFIPQSERPAVKIDPDKSVGELTVRDLQTILGGSEIYKVRKDKDFDKYGKDYLKEHEYDKYFIEKYAIEIQVQQGNPGYPAAGGINQLVEHVGGLHKKIDDLSNQIAELKKK
jgi:hypothetical protein